MVAGDSAGRGGKLVSGGGLGALDRLVVGSRQIAACESKRKRDSQSRSRGEHRAGEWEAGSRLSPAEQM